MPSSPSARPRCPTPLREPSTAAPEACGHPATPDLSESALSDSRQHEGQALGAWLVFGAALVWSLGGIIARLAEVENPWITVFWRSGTATLRSEEHTSELQSLMRISYAVFCFKKKPRTNCIAN